MYGAMTTAELILRRQNTSVRQVGRDFLIIVFYQTHASQSRVIADACSSEVEVRDVA